MNIPAFDILKKADNDTLVWVQASPDLNSATARAHELADNSGDEYVVYDQGAQRIVTKAAKRNPV